MFPPGDTIRQERPTGFGSETHSNTPLTLECRNNPLTLECRALTQRRPWVRFDSRGTREPTRITRRAVILGRAARGPAFLRKATCQAWRVLFSFGPRSPTRAPPYRERPRYRPRDQGLPRPWGQGGVYPKQDAPGQSHTRRVRSGLQQVRADERKAVRCSRLGQHQRVLPLSARAPLPLS
jgi:hypothetical protein